MEKFNMEGPSVQEGTLSPEEEAQMEALISEVDKLQEAAPNAENLSPEKKKNLLQKYVTLNNVLIALGATGVIAGFAGYQEPSSTTTVDTNYLPIAEVGMGVLAAAAGALRNLKQKFDRGELE